MQQYGTGSNMQKAAQAVTAVLQGLAGGDMGKALAGGLSPYMAGVIHDMTTRTVQTPNGPKDEINVTANLMAHAVLGAVVAQVNGNSALAGASGAVAGEYIAQQLYSGKDRSKLTEQEKQSISTLATLASGLAGGITGNSTANALAGAQAGKNAVENNALANVLGAAEAKKKGTIDKYEKSKKAYCELMPDACEQAGEILKGGADFSSDFIPIYGDIKSFKEADTAIDYLAATIGLIPGAGDVAGKIIKSAEKALKNGNVAEASKLIHKASDEISGHLPSPGNISLPSSGIGSNAAFKVSNSQLGKKLGKHVEDFGGDASNAADRQRVLNIINDIGSHPDKVVAGKFAGQGVGGSRGDVFFRVKGNDVVVTKPDGSFVTVLKDEINNTSVKNALKGDPK